MTTNSSQLFLLADHIKLSLLERQRAISLNLDPNTNDPQIARSLDQLQSGIAALEAQSQQWDDPLHPSTEQQELSTAISSLKAQYSDLSSTFTSPTPSTSPPDTLTSPNDASLASDFARAQQTKPSKASKSVRFTDAAPDPNRAALFPSRYTDEPDAAADQAGLTNAQIHAYHQTVLRQQDDQLDRLGESITRQHDLSIQIGNELDDQALMLDEVDERVERHQSGLERARGRLGRVARGAKEHWSWTVIIVLIVILVLLIVITKR